MIDIERQLKKGVLSIIVLKLLSLKDMYGYELMKLLEQQSDGYYKLKEGSLYPVLYRLEDKKLIKSYWKNEGSKKTVPRKYYKVTQQGTDAIGPLIEKWSRFMKVSNDLLLQEGGVSNEK